MDKSRQGNVTYMDTKDYELQVYFGKPPPSPLARLRENVRRILDKQTITQADRMEMCTLSRKYKAMRRMSIVS